MSSLPSDYTICAYMRLSKEDDDIFGRKLESDSVTLQRNLIMDFIRRQPEFAHCHVIERCDDGISGRYFDTRPQFTDMIDLAKKGKINCIIVKDCSRFGRDYVELGDYLEQLFPFFGIRFIAINDHYDSSRSEGGLDIAFKNLVYDVYSRDLSKKMRTTMRQLAVKGKYTATQALYGYRKRNNDKHSLEPDPETAPIVREIFDMRLSGISLSDIARNLNDRGIKCASARKVEREEECTHNKGVDYMCWTAGVIENMLSNEIYTGTVVSLKHTMDRVTGKMVKKPESEWVRVEGMHEPIVSKEDFEKVQEMIRHRESSGLVRRVHYRCGICGKALTKEKGNAVYCKRGFYMNEDCECRNVKGSKQMINAIVLDELKRKLRCVMDEEELKLEQGRNGSEETSSAETVMSALDAVKQAKQMLFEKLADRAVDRESYKAKMADYNAQIADFEHKLETAKVRESFKADAEGRMNEAKSFLEVQNMTEEMWEKFVEDVYVFPEGRLEIRWRFEEV